MSPHSTSLYATQDIKHIKLSYDNADSDATALKLVFALFPGWEHDEGPVHVIRFTDGITNTVRCCVPIRHQPPWTGPMHCTETSLIAPES